MCFFIQVLQNTNVIELYSRIIKDDKQHPQLTYYNSGIGTYARPSWRSYTYWKQVLDNKIDLAIAWYQWSLFYVLYTDLTDPLGTLKKLFLRAIAGCQIIISLATGSSFLARDSCSLLGRFRSSDRLFRVLPWSLSSARTRWDDKQGAIDVAFAQCIF